MALVYIFVKVLDGLDAGAHLDIYVAVEHPQQIRVVRHNPSVIQHLTAYLSLTTIVPLSINWV